MLFCRATSALGQLQGNLNDASSESLSAHYAYADKAKSSDEQFRWSASTPLPDMFPALMRSMQEEVPEGEPAAAVFSTGDEESETSSSAFLDLNLVRG